MPLSSVRGSTMGVFSTTLREDRSSGVLRRRRGGAALLAVLAATSLFAAATDAVAADSVPLRLSSLLESSGQPPVPLSDLRPRSSWVSIGGSEWGWWLWNRRQDEEQPGPETEERVGEAEEEEEGGSYGEDAGPRGDAGASGMRIGIELGAFLPFGEKEESFRSGQMCGVLVGFGLLSPAPGILVTDEIRILEGTTSSLDQTSGYDVSSLVFAVKNDFLLHFFPAARGFNVHAFLGFSLGIERTTAKKGTLEDTDTGFWFLCDAGLGAWVTLAGPVDLLLRIEFDFIPTSDNVPFFAVGLMGLQMRF
jgi:hypothetical protein